jgi:hypothetical protein
MTTSDDSTLATPARSGLYLYAFADSGAEIPQGLRGLHDAPVSVVTSGGIAAVASPIPRERLRPERRHLAAHQSVLAGLMASTTVLPVGFGMIVPGASRLRAMIDSESESLAEQLDGVRGRVEMSVRLSYDVENIFQHLVADEPALKAARDSMLANPGHHQAKVAAGEMFSKTLEARRAQYESHLLSMLDAASEEIISEPPRTDQEIARLAVLVARERMADFEASLGQAAAAFDADFRFDFSGPWAPHSFVRLRISPDQAAGVS